jgi:hypothetical protein
LARSDAELLAWALGGAIAASAGDVGLLWVAWAADGRLGVVAPPRGTLFAGHYLGVLGIPLYGLGYRALAAGIRDTAPSAARWVVGLGAVGSVVGAIVHGLTGVLTSVALRTGAPTAPDALLAIPEAEFLMPLWVIVGGALAVGSVLFAGAVRRGGTCFPRAFALCNPLLVTATLAVLALPVPALAAFVVPAAPNLAHVIVFAAALRARRSSARRDEESRAW